MKTYLIQHRNANLWTEPRKGGRTRLGGTINVSLTNRSDRVALERLLEEMEKQLEASR